MSGQNDELEVNLGNLGYETLTRYNTSLFTFLGETALDGPLHVYNHVFVHQDETETAEEYAFYIFKDSDYYEEIRSHIVRHNFPQHLNLTDVAKMDRYAFDFTHGIDANAGWTVPEGWAEPGGDLPPDPNTYDLGDENGN